MGLQVLSESDFPSGQIPAKPTGRKEKLSATLPNWLQCEGVTTRFGNQRHCMFRFIFTATVTGLLVGIGLLGHAEQDHAARGHAEQGKNQQEPKVKAPRSIDEMVAEQVEKMRERLRSGTVNERSAAAKGLGMRGAAAKDAVPELIAQMKNSAITDEGVSLWVTLSRAIVDIGESSIPMLQASLQTDDLNTYRGVVGALQLLNADLSKSAPLLIEHLESRPAEYRVTTLFALVLADQAARPAIPRMIELLDDKNFHVQYASCQVLAAIGPDAKAAIPKLAFRLNKGLTSVRGHAALALGSIGPPHPNSATEIDVVAALIESLSDYSNPVRDRVLVALREIGTAVGPKAADEIQQLVVAGNNRIQASVTLWHVSDRKELPVETLIELATGNEVELEAINALGELGSGAAAAVDILILKLSSADVSIQIAAASALGEIGPAAATAIPGLSLLVTHFDSELRRAAKEALAKIGKGETAPSAADQTDEN